MSEKHLLHRLASLYGVQTAYYDLAGRRVDSPPEAIVRVLGMLGAPLERMHDIKDALRQRRDLLWQRVIEPVIVAWDGRPLRLKLRLPVRLADAAATYKVVLENDDSREGQCHGVPGINSPGQTVEGQCYVTRSLLLPDRVPPGYHRLHLNVGGLALEAHLIAAPLQAYAEVDSRAKSWGLFCPLYSLASENSWGAGDFSDLESFIDFAGRFGAGVVGTLPLLASFLDEPFNPSPYAPASRLFWNEFYLDVERLPEFRSCPTARSIISNGFVTQLEALRGAPLVDYRRVMTLKRRILEALVCCLLRQSSVRRADFERFIAEHPLAQDYASFRAKVERERKPWEQWPQTPRDGLLRSADYDEKNRQYHLYVQWQAHEQMGAVGDKTKTGGPGLYLDFPLGVNRDGYDVWRERGVFALGASGGAPPDGFFIKGQDWGFPPLHPEGLRRQGYRYYANCVRHLLRYAKMLRIDHVMGLHRFYWVPHGFAAPEGVYVRYPAEEFYAVLNLESHRYGARLVGENLGTVPPYVNAALARHRIHTMYVGQFGISPNPETYLEQVSDGTVASLNTHDTPTFAGFWNERDIEDRVKLGLLPENEVAGERHNRAYQREVLVAYLKSRGWLDEPNTNAAAVLRAWLYCLANGRTGLLLVNLEDLWLEPLPQNVPGTWEERPNWKRKAQFPLDELRRTDFVVETLKAINDIRLKVR